MKRILWIFLSVLFLLGAGHFYYYLTGDFQVSYLLQTEASQPISNNDFHSSLAQTYTYLGHGHQTYAFLSEDGLRVLKLFKKDYFERTPWIHVFPPIPPFRDYFLSKGRSKDQRRTQLLNGYQTAYSYGREDGGLLYFHPQQTNDPKLKTILITPLGSKISIDLNSYLFAIQIKVIRTKDELNRLLSQGKVEEAKMRLRALLDLYFRGYVKGILDNDHNLLDNTGFYKDRAIRQDIGKIVKKSDLDYDAMKKDLAKITNERLGPWLNKKYPQYSKELIDDMQNHIAEFLLHNHQ